MRNEAGFIDVFCTRAIHIARCYLQPQAELPNHEPNVARCVSRLPGGMHFATAQVTTSPESNMLQLQGGLVTVLAVFITEPQPLFSTGVTVGLSVVCMVAIAIALLRAR